MNVKNNFEDVVSLNLEGEIWKTIDSFPLYEVSTFGRVRTKAFDKIKIVQQSKLKSYKSTYLGVSLLNIDLVYVTTLVHVHVCKTFNGDMPNDGQEYEVNHKDGNKHNNVPSNLEWMTRRENLIHAYKTGLRKDNTPVIVTDINTGEKTSYYSMAEIGRVFNIPEGMVNRIIHHHGVKPYMNKYTFRKDFSNRVSAKYEWMRDIKAYDYLEKTIIIASDSGIMEAMTGVNRMTLLAQLREGRSNLINGYVFKYMDDLTQWPEHNNAEVLESKELYHNKGIRRGPKTGITVRDYIADSIKEYATMKDASLDTGVNRGTIEYLANKEKTSIFKGKVFKYTEDDFPWPEYSKEKIELSLRVKKPEYLPLKITDLETNTTKLYVSAAEFAREISEDPVSVAACFRLYGKYKQRWIATRVEL